MIPLLATFEEIDCISPILLTDAKDNKKRVFLVIFLNDTSLRGSKGGDIRAINRVAESESESEGVGGFSWESESESESDF